MGATAAKCWVVLFFSLFFPQEDVCGLRLEVCVVARKN